MISTKKMKYKSSATIETSNSNSHLKKRRRGTAAAPMKIHHLSDHHECVFHNMESNESSILFRKKRYNDGREIDKVVLRDEVDRRRRDSLQSLGRMHITGTQPEL
jgi:hypothetical protein